MSEELIKSLQRRVTELEGENVNLKAEAKDRRVKGKKLSEANEKLEATVSGLTKERDQFKTAAESSHPELTAKVAELEGEIRAGKHRKAFDKAAGDAGVRAEALDDLWTLSGYKADAPEPDQAVITQAIDAAKAARSYLFQPAEDATSTTTEPPAGTPPPKTKLDVAIDNNRGGGSLAANVFRVTTAQYQDPGWMHQNSAKIAEHRKSGTLVFAE